MSEVVKKAKEPLKCCGYMPARNGFDKKGRQRYRCPECKKSFIEKPSPDFSPEEKEEIVKDFKESGFNQNATAQNRGITRYRLGKIVKEVTGMDCKTLVVSFFQKREEQKKEEPKL